MMFLVSILLKTQIFGFILVIVQLETPEFEKVSTQEEHKTFVEKLDEACNNFLPNSMYTNRFQRWVQAFDSD